MGNKEVRYIQEGDRIVADNVDLEAEDSGRFGINFLPASDGTFLENAEFKYYDPDSGGLYEIQYDNDYNPYVEL